MTVDAGVIDADFRGIVYVVMFNHHPYKPFVVDVGYRIGQVVFMKKFDVTNKTAK